MRELHSFHRPQRSLEFHWVFINTAEGELSSLASSSIGNRQRLRTNDDYCIPISIVSSQQNIHPCKWWCRSQFSTAGVKGGKRKTRRMENERICDNKRYFAFSCLLISWKTKRRMSIISPTRLYVWIQLRDGRAMRVELNWVDLKWKSSHFSRFHLNKMRQRMNMRKSNDYYLNYKKI